MVQLIGIFILIQIATEPSVNSNLETLIKMIRSNNLDGTDFYWDQYTVSLLDGGDFSKHTQQLGGLTNIGEHESKFADGLWTEAEFCHQIGLEFSKDGGPTSSEWFLNKAESLGLVDRATYSARVRNYTTEWNSILHHNGWSDPTLSIIENKWRENLTKFIQHSSDSADIYEARLKLTSIYWPFRTPIFVDSFAPITIENLESFISEYPDNPFIERAYERLVWWFCKTKRYTKLCETCVSFLKKYPNAQITEYIKIQLGNAHYFTQEYAEAKDIYLSVRKDALPHSVYPGWGGQYLLEELNRKLKELEDKD